MSAAVVGGDKAIAVPSAARRQNAKHTKKPREDIARPQRAKKLIVKLKNVGGLE